ncbi:hypothetical protein [Dyadobacter bucti]|uniref:hypothetical protein n=1 Tax=Dyadobacter bucti TaxID=2572203 RepID=UPI003F72B053
MTYKEQLLHELWRARREVTISRDKKKCQNCNNQVYKDFFDVGLIFGNNIPHGTAKPFLHKNSYGLHIWDFKADKINLAFTESQSFNPNNSYIAVYKESGKYSQLIALKDIRSQQIELTNNLLGLVKNGIKAKISEQTYYEIYRPEQDLDSWSMALGLHVHHHYYQHGLLAWEYPDDALTTLCWECHKRLHANTVIPVLDSSGKRLGHLTPCKRCFGAGIFPEYVHIESGVCFECRGARFLELLIR